MPIRLCARARVTTSACAAWSGACAGSVLLPIINSRVHRQYLATGRQRGGHRMLQALRRVAEAAWRTLHIMRIDDQPAFAARGARQQRFKILCVYRQVVQAMRLERVEVGMVFMHAAAGHATGAEALAAN